VRTFAFFPGAFRAFYPRFGIVRDQQNSSGAGTRHPLSPPTKLARADCDFHGEHRGEDGCVGGQRHRDCRQGRCWSGGIWAAGWLVTASFRRDLGRLAYRKGKNARSPHGPARACGEPWVSAKHAAGGWGGTCSGWDVDPAPDGIWGTTGRGRICPRTPRLSSRSGRRWSWAFWRRAGWGPIALE
jgi:hypothetical protein